VVEKLHRVSAENGILTFVVELRNDDHGVTSTLWLGPKGELLKQDGTDLVVEASGHRYVLCDVCDCC